MCYDLKMKCVILIDPLIMFFHLESDRPRPTPRPNKNDRKLIRVADVNKTVDLSCDYSNNEQVKWRRVDAELSGYSREDQGKLFIYYLETKDSGEYECYLPNGVASRIKLNVRDPRYSTETDLDYQNDDDLYSVRVYIDKSRLELKYGANDVITCEAITNGNNLEIQWYNPKGQVNIYSKIF